MIVCKRLHAPARNHPTTHLRLDRVRRPLPGAGSIPRSSAVQPVVTAVLNLTALGAATASTPAGPGGLGPQPTLLVLLVLAATAAGLVMRRRDGRFRASARTDRVDAAQLGRPLGSRRTFLQVSAATCATCPQVARVLGSVADGADGVAHVEIRVEEHDALARRLGVLRTPTVLLLDADGFVLSRTSGPLRPDQARAALVADDLDPVAARR